MLSYPRSLTEGLVDGWVISMKHISTFLAILLITSSCSNEGHVQTDVKDQDEANTPKLFLRPKPFEKKLKGAVIVASLNGDVRVINLFQSNESDRNKVKPKALKAGEIVSQGSTIVSGKNSEVDILFTNGTSAKIGQNSKLTISAIWQKDFKESSIKVVDINEETSPTRIDLDLEIGDLIVDVKKLKKESSFRVSSPLGVAGIRGTQFRIFSENEKVELSVLKGEVSFWDSNYGQKEITNSEKFVLEMNLEPIFKPLNQIEKQTIQRTIASLKKSTETYDLSNLAKKLGTKETKTQPVDEIKETLENISYDISNDLVAWWPFDRDSKDASGNNRHAEPKNEFSFVDGKVGKAIKLVGVAKQQSFEGGHVMLPYLEELENGAFTFSLWVREDKVYFGSGHTYIFYGTICNIKHAPAPEWGGHLFDFGDDQSFQEKIVWKDWNHYSVTYDRTTKIGYLNGIEVLSEESPSPSTSHWWAKRRDKDGELIYFKPPNGLTKIGSQVKPRYKKGALGAQWFYNGSTGSTRFVGAFDDVRIYDRALSAAEIQALYKLGQ